MKFLIECLADLDDQFREVGSRLLIFSGNPVEIFKNLNEKLGINKICYEQDCEPIWRERDQSVENLCLELGIKVVEKVSHTLWNPMDVINANGGYAPLTYEMMLHTVNVLGLPQRPVNDKVDFSNVEFGKIPDSLYQELSLMEKVKKHI